MTDAAHAEAAARHQAAARKHAELMAAIDALEKHL